MGLRGQQVVFHDGWLTFLTELLLFPASSSPHVTFPTRLLSAMRVGEGVEPRGYDIPAWEGLKLNCGSEVLIGKPKSGRTSGAAVN